MASHEMTKFEDLHGEVKECTYVEPEALQVQTGKTQSASKRKGIVPTLS